MRAPDPTFHRLGLVLALGAIIAAGPVGAGVALPGTRPAARATSGVPSAAGAGARAALDTNGPDVPGIDPDYIYAQLDYLATHFLHREAGYDTGLPPTVNGHDEFAAYWSAEMARDLQGFGPTFRRDPFATLGWRGRAPSVPAFNVEVTVPGATQPERMVVIGCHYDGEASSTQSAFDDASGCAIELGVARALAAYWRARHLYPARTVRFVIFDAEEQGLFGSFHYVNSTINGDLANVVTMFDEEQSGIGYPVRFLGSVDEPLLPFFAYVAPTAGNALYPDQSQLDQARLGAIQRFRAAVEVAIPAAFASFRAEGFGTLAYHRDSGGDMSLPIFAPGDTGNVQVLDDDVGSSDQVPFTLAGLPCAMFVGNFTYYDRNPDGSPPPPWSYPYDQPQDTLQLMNVYAHDDTTKSEALALALGLGGMMTTTLLARPDVLGSAPVARGPLAAIGDLGPTVVGLPLRLDASASYDPAAGARLTYAWDFGDGTSGSGVALTHTYTAPGVYTLSLTVRAPDGTRKESKVITVTTQPHIIANHFDNDGFLLSGHPTANPLVHLPTAHEAPPNAKGKTGQGPSGTALALGALVVVLILGGLVFGVIGHRRRERQRRRERRKADADRRRRAAALHDLAGPERPAGASPHAGGDAEGGRGEAPASTPAP